MRSALPTWEERLDLPDCDIDAACWGDDVMESVVDAATHTRAQAIAGYVAVTLDAWTDVRAYKRWAYFPTRREQWLRHIASERYWGPRPAPGVPPRGWYEEDHCWWLVHRRDPRGVPVWIVIGSWSPSGYVPFGPPAPAPDEQGGPDAG